MPRGRRSLSVATLEADEQEPMASMPSGTNAPNAASLSPERQALAKAIADLAATDAEIAEANAAIQKAEDDGIAASHALREAERAFQRSKPRESSFTPMQPPGTYWNSEAEYQAYVREESAPPLSIADARAAVDRATDDRDSAKRSFQFHKDRVQRLDFVLYSRRSAVNSALRAVVRADPALAALAASAKRHATLAAAAAAAFELATNSDVIQPGSPFYGCTRPTDARTDFTGWELSRKWRTALEQLQTDATCPLPMPDALP